MAQRKRLVLLLAAAAALLCGARDAHADLPCAGRPTVLQEYERAGVIVVARIVSIDQPKEDGAAAAQAEEPAEAEGEKGQEDEGEGPGEAEQSKVKRRWVDFDTSHAGNITNSLFTRMVVERSYKGPLKAGDEMLFARAGGRHEWFFTESDVGRRILFYLPMHGKDQKFWSAGVCGRGGSVEQAADDLLFLNNLRRARGRTRLSGTLAFKFDEGLGVANRTIRVVGAQKTYEVKTDEHGVYEIYDLPAGRYFVDPGTPPGWKVSATWPGDSAGHAASDEGGSGGKAAKGLPVVVADKRHAGLDIRFEIDNTMGGKVYNAAGKPMRGVCLRLFPAAAEQQAAFPYKAACTEADGAFLLDEIPTGSYVLVVNEDGKITSSEPFGKFYYPNVAERERAAVITIGPGDRVTALDIRPPAAIETITVEGRFLYSDGQPVVGETVEFKPEKDAGNVEGGAKTYSDAAGRFSLNILKGLKGQLHGQMGVYYGKFDNCPKLEAFLKRIARGHVVKTPALVLSADADPRDVELRYPFPSCQQERDQE